MGPIIWFNLRTSSLLLLMLSLVGALRRDTLLTAWLIFEVNLLRFLVILFTRGQGGKIIGIYFVVQRFGSLGFLLAGTLRVSQIRALSRRVFVFSLILKLGAAPFHWWLVRLMPQLDWLQLIILSTVQKVLPAYFIFKAAPAPAAIFILFNLVVGLAGLAFQKQLKVVLAYYSLIRIGWLIVLFPNFNLAMAYLISLGVSLIIISHRVSLSYLSVSSKEVQEGSHLLGRVSISIGVLSLARFPPVLAFFLKLAMVFRTFSNNFSIVGLMLALRSPVILITLMEWGLSKWGLQERNNWERPTFYFSRSVRVALLLAVRGGLALILSSSNSA